MTQQPPRDYFAYFLDHWIPYLHTTIPPHWRDTKFTLPTPIFHSIFAFGSLDSSSLGERKVGAIPCTHFFGIVI